MYNAYDLTHRKIYQTNNPILINKETLANTTVYNYNNIFYWEGEVNTVKKEIFWKYKIYGGNY